MTALRILEKDSNRSGDLFGRLMADLFVALGYDRPRMNIHKSGREIDLAAEHRLEQRRAIGECKATAAPIGGDDVNKFVGALDAEYDKNVNTEGYFISLSGFKETALEQERHRRRTKIVMLTGEQVVAELIKGRILVPPERAVELAGRFCALRPELTLDGDPDLVAHDLGWIWIVYYATKKARNAFTLIHADGTSLASALAQDIVRSDTLCGGSLHQLECLNPQTHTARSDKNEMAALAAYGHYIAEECGYIHLDGLPADSDVGSRRLRLENLFVPLHFDVGPESIRRTIGNVLEEHSRLAILAAPGGGKSTLIKRLAVAYVDRKRREEVGDELPDREWFPLFFRCRELRGLARASFWELLEAPSEREPVRQHASDFLWYADQALANGRVLLLVDGLDEISDPGDRAAFVCTMRTALQAYPKTAIIVTSREAGFRHVAAHIVSICTQVTLSPFSSDDIRRLSVAWHAEVVGHTEKVRTDAEQLAGTITRNDRILRLAINPLLLTTLLLVKRWVGSLPTRRAVLYRKAVEVLLMTWNTEGHEPMPEDEALPQLCYVASAMMMAEVERVSRARLATLIAKARGALPTELGYVKETIEEFIHRVEDRSSLLMMTGHDVEDGQLVEFFEFRHLTFQEFLTALAMVHGWHPDRKDSDTLVTVLAPHFRNEKWREVIPLAASIGGKATEGLISELTRVFESTAEADASSDPLSIALGSCLADEAPARPETIQAALRALVLRGLGFSAESFVSMLARGRHGAELRREAEEAFLHEQNFRGPTISLKTVVRLQESEGIDLSSRVTMYLQMSRGTTTLERCKGALGLAQAAEALERQSAELSKDLLCAIAEHCLPLLFSDDPRENYSAGWALYNVGKCGVWRPTSEAVCRMFELWRHSDYLSVRLGLSTTLAAQKIPSRSEFSPMTIEPQEIDRVLRGYDKLNDHEKECALIISWYTRALGDADIIERASGMFVRPESGLTDVLRDLGVDTDELRRRRHARDVQVELAKPEETSSSLLE